MYTYFFLLLTALYTGQYEYNDLFWDEATKLELVDERERRYIGVRLQDLDSDLALVWRRYEELKDAPNLADADRLIDRETINHYLAFNRQYRNTLDHYIIRDENIRNAISETDNLYQIWDTMRDAKCLYYYVNVRRAALQILRDKVGEAAYYSNDWPPYLPLWRFNTIN